MYKKVLIISFLSLIFLFNTNVSFAQETNYSLTKVSYENNQQLDEIMANCYFIIDYYQGEEIENPFMLGLFTQPQLKILDNKYQYQVFNENVADLKKYVLLNYYGTDAETILNQYGSYWKLNNNFYLFQLPEDENFSLEQNLVGFHETLVPDKPLPTPLYQTNKITPIPTKISLSPTPASAPAKNNLVLPIIISLVVIILIFAGLIIFQKNKNKQI